MRAVGLDLGEKRIGVAVTAGTLAMPHAVIQRSGDAKVDHSAVARMVEELGGERLVVGLPLSLDGSHGPAARRAEAEAEELRAVVAVPVELFDERLTTVSATRSLAAAGVRGRAQRRVVDQVAAAVLLQAWLDQVEARTEEC
ncbi:MAG: Holliday junction resolvase RuvX [Acidimicrobiales bacterium]